MIPIVAIHDTHLLNAQGKPKGEGTALLLLLLLFLISKSHLSLQQAGSILQSLQVQDVL